MPNEPLPRLTAEQICARLDTVTESALKSIQGAPAVPSWFLMLQGIAPWVRMHGVERLRDPEFSDGGIEAADRPFVQCYVTAHINGKEARCTRHNSHAGVHFFWTDPNTAGQSTEAVRGSYHELLYAVGKKFPGESRHETALRYIQQAESSTGASASAASLSEEHSNDRRVETIEDEGATSDVPR
jgi:hypothetical protein